MWYLSVSASHVYQNREVKKNIYGRAHVANVILDKGFARSRREVFQSLIGNDCPAYVPKKQKDLKQLTDLIHSWGGFSVVAHPGLQNLQEELTEFKEQGVDGIEVFHPEHSNTVTKRLLEKAEKLSFLITGGSDSHGLAKIGQPPGCTLLEDKYVRRLQEAHNAKVH